MTQGKGFGRREHTVLWHNGLGQGIWACPVTQSPFTYCKCQKEEFVEEDRVSESSTWFYGFPYLPQEKKSVKVSYQHLWAFHSQVKHRTLQPRTLLSHRPSTTFPRQWNGLLPHSAHCPLLSASHSCNRLLKGREPRGLLSVDLSMPVISFNKYLLVS